MASTKTPLDLLVEAREIIAPPSAWTTHTYARDQRGAGCPPEGDRAVCWCAIGALYRAAGSPVEDAPDNVERALTILREQLDASRPEGLERVGVGTYNDTHDHAEVLVLYGRAIACAGAT